MNFPHDPMNAAEGRAMLDQLPEVYFAVLKNAQIEQQADKMVRCTFELPVIGTRTKTGVTARDAIRAVLIELSEFLTRTPVAEWPKDWCRLAASADSGSEVPIQSAKGERFQSKARQFTIGVTMPVRLKESLAKLSDQQKGSFAEVARQFASLGFEDFDERSFSEGSRELLRAIACDIGGWQSSETEQVMVRLDPHLAVRLRSAAKENGRSASEFSALCLAHGLVLHDLLIAVEKKIAGVRGSRIRTLAPKVGLGKRASLLSGILAGTVTAPTKILRGLSEIFETPEYALTAFFRRSFENRAVPAFKAEKGKPEVFQSPSSWKNAVESLSLPAAETKELLLLDE